MSTRSAICVLTKQSDRNRKLNAWGVQLPSVTATDQKPYLACSCHWDGYRSGVGQDLVNHFNSYEAALELTLQGAKENVIDPWANDPICRDNLDRCTAKAGADPINCIWGEFKINAEYTYIWGLDDRWHCYRYYNKHIHELKMPKRTRKQLPAIMR